MSRNVVLICLDTVRKDFFEQYAPQLCDLADVSFEQTRAASSWSVPSHASMLTGQLPHQHGVHTYNTDFSTIPHGETFLADLSSHRSICVSANVWATSTFGFTDHFDSYSDVSPRRHFPNGADMKQFQQERNEERSKYLQFFRYAYHHDYPMQTFANGVFSKTKGLLKRLPIPSPFDDGARAIVRESLTDIEDGDEPFFLFTNFMDAHAPVHPVWAYDRSLYSVSPSWSSANMELNELNIQGISRSDEEDVANYRELYAAAIDYLDRVIANFISRIDQITSHETTFIITADHGENLGFDSEDGLFEHVSSLSEALLHVPFYLVNPPSGYASTESEYFSHLRLGELVTDLARGETSDIFDSRIVAELVGGNHAIRNAVNTAEEREYWDRMQRCAYAADRKYVWDSLDERFEYEIDHEEPSRHRLVTDEAEVPAWTDGAFDIELKTYDSETTSERESIDVDVTTEQRLEALGYK